MTQRGGTVTQRNHSGASSTEWPATSSKSGRPWKSNVVRAPPRLGEGQRDPFARTPTSIAVDCEIANLLVNGQASLVRAGESQTDSGGQAWSRS